ncbi:U2 small nuclear ribonucleoprotein B'' 2-like [Quercus lobata]|uniref:U2 small nuclear ribonucleoprotein B'' 2-like n=1 Tax=Quercus lobata TaxID=97700 RepID=UPI0012458E87|nr:U2 small nuclear ribonucleoprotein B'' 2-like [Quercus lobata]
MGLKLDWASEGEEVSQVTILIDHGCLNFVGLVPQRVGFDLQRIQYAKTKSDCIAKEDGSYDKKKKQEEKAERKRCAEEAQQSTMPNGASAQNGGSTASFRHGNSSAQEAVAPNNILFIENLPHEATSMMLEMLFQQHPGFREVRMIVVKPGIAFVEFEDDQQSSMAMQTLQGFKITPQNPMTITFAKK